jgi:integral membrane sensor domain MASE1
MCHCQCPDPSDNINDANATQLVSDATAAIIFTAACLLYLSYKMLAHGAKAGLESALFSVIWLIGRLVGVFEWICRAAYRDLTALA